MHFNSHTIEATIACKSSIFLANRKLFVQKFADFKIFVVSLHPQF